MRVSRTVPVIATARRGAFLGITTVAVSLLASAGAPAQQPAQQQPEAAAWRVECTGDGKALDCRAVQQLFQRDTRQLVLSIQVRRAPDPKAALMQIQLPLGLNLTEPLQLKVDNGAPEKQPIQTCTNTGCFVSMTASEKLLTAMRSGTELKITMTDLSKRPLDLSVPLLGFGLAFDKAKS